MSAALRVKICGITDSHQAIEIVKMGATTLGFICVPQSPRYVDAAHIAQIVSALHSELGYRVPTIGVFADASLDTIREVVEQSELTGVQLHGQESVEFCAALKTELPQHELIKAFRIKDEETLESIQAYLPWVDSLLLDAYHPQALGGTGLAWDWTLMKSIKFSHPWLLAGGLNPHNVRQALESCAPTGIDLSSGVEQAPGIKDLAKVQQLFSILNR